MDNTTSGWDIWYSRLEPEWSDEVIPQTDLEAWGREFQRLFRFCDHSGYTQSEPMLLDDAMTMAFVLDQAGVNVEAVLDLCRAYSPFELDDLVSIPLCFMLDPLGHVDGMLEKLQEIGEPTGPDMDQIRQGIETMGGPAPDDPEVLLNVFHSGLLDMIRFLSELQLALGEYGLATLNAWWQGRLIGLLREEADARPRRARRAGRDKGSAVPDAFRDLIQGLDLDSGAPPSGRY